MRTKRKKEESLNPFDPPSIFDDYGNEEILGVEDYGDEELVNFKELEEALVPLSFCEEEELDQKEELHVFPYKATRLHQEYQV